MRILGMVTHTHDTGIALVKDGVRVSTVEHLMAALCGCGVDNVLIEIHGPEALERVAKVHFKNTAKLR